MVGGLTAGGGMIAGVAIAAKAINSAICILVAEHKGADDMHRNLRQQGG